MPIRRGTTSGESDLTRAHEPRDQVAGGRKFDERDASFDVQVAATTSAHAVSTDHGGASDIGSRWQREFDLRSQDSRAGLHHPTVLELVLGMPPLHNSVDLDAQTFAEKLLARLAKDGVTEGILFGKLMALTLAPTPELCRSAASALLAAWEAKPAFEASHLAEASARCDFYAAVKDCDSAAYLTAGRALVLSKHPDLPDDAQLALVQAALGWLLDAARRLPAVVVKLGPGSARPPVRRAADLGHDAMQHIGALLHHR